ncbi:MAG: hypothetical protein F7B95_01745 [Desulfurococcales archaeon]|nr:hypothetical protein [Desulfurococcales archaeon]
MNWELTEAVARVGPPSYGSRLLKVVRKRILVLSLASLLVMVSSGLLAIMHIGGREGLIVGVVLIVMGVTDLPLMYFLLTSRISNLTRVFARILSSIAPPLWALVGFIGLSLIMKIDSCLVLVQGNGVVCMCQSGAGNPRPTGRLALLACGTPRGFVYALTAGILLIVAGVLASLITGSNAVGVALTILGSAVMAVPALRYYRGRSVRIETCIPDPLRPGYAYWGQAILYVIHSTYGLSYEKVLARIRECESLCSSM